MKETYGPFKPSPELQAMLDVCPEFQALRTLSLADGLQRVFGLGHRRTETGFEFAWIEAVSDDEASGLRK